MLKSLIYIALCVLSSVNAFAAGLMPLTGSWRGKIGMGAISLPLVFNFDSDSIGNPQFTLDSPQQNVKGLPLTVNHLSEDSIAVASNSIGAIYEGKISDGVIEGTFSQRGFRFPLTLIPEQPIELRRPQTPVPPFPYQSVDTVFTAADGVKIAGTIVIPDGGLNEIPLVVMTTGSGPQNRDEEIFEHKPFAVIADHLARNGIASFRYDDRGVAKSEGDFASATIQTFESDSESAVKFIRGLNRFGSVGILGHSEGGTIAMMLASRQVPNFIISLAGMVIPGKETILDQNRHLMETIGLSEKEMDGGIALVEAVFDEIINHSGQIDVDKIAASMDISVPSGVLQSIRQNVAHSTPYFRELLSTNAGPELKHIQCPFLALNGDRDTQVNASKNLDVIRTNSKRAVVHELAGLNHLFQHAVTGDMSEYDEIRETISPQVLDIIVEFIKTIPAK